MSKLEEMVDAEGNRITNSFREDYALQRRAVVKVAVERMATFMRSDTAFRAMCEERLERLEAERLPEPNDLDTLSRFTKQRMQIAALRALLEGV